MRQRSHAHPTEIIGFHVRVEMCRGDTIVIPTALRHDIPYARALETTARGIIGIVIVHRPQSMPHFVAARSDT